MMLTPGPASAERKQDGPKKASYTFVAAPGESPFDLCDRIVLEWGVPQSVLDDKFNTRMCSSGSSSSDFPAYPALGAMRYPWGSGDDYTEARSIKVYGSPGLEDPTACGVANPILPATGTKIQTEVDYFGVGKLPLQVIRTYSSANPLGLDASHWTWSLGNRMTLDPVQGDSRAIAYYPDRRLVHFRERTDGSWATLGGTRIRLTRTGNSWALSDFDGDRVETFDEAGRPVEVSKGGQSLSYSYDSVDGEDRTIVSDAFGKRIEIYHNDDDDPARIVDPAGNIIWYQYAGPTGPYRDNLTGVVYGDGSTTPPSGSISRLYHYELDAYPNWYSRKILTGITDERGVRYATWTYGSTRNKRGSYSNHFYAKSSEHAGVDLHLVDPITTPGSTRITNPLGKEAIFRYAKIDGVSRLVAVDGQTSANCVAATRTLQYDDTGFVSREVDREGNVTDYARNDRGLAEATTQAAGTADERTTTVRWHAQFALPEVVVEPGRRTEYTYSPYDDPNHKRMSVTDLASGSVRTWDYTYGAQGQLLTVDGPRTDVADVTTYTYHDCTTGAECGQVASVIDAEGHATSYDAYDAHGKPVQVTNSNGQQITFAYDLRQRMTSVTVAGATASFSHDAKGNVTRITNADGTFVDFERDAADRLTAVVDAQGHRIEWALDAAGNRVDEAVRDASGQLRKALQREFDELSRLRATVQASGARSTMDYDRNGNPVLATDAADRDTRMSYDALDRLVLEIDPLLGETRFTYNAQDNLTSVTDAEGKTTTYTHNGFGDLVAQTSPDTGTTTYAVDAAGNRTSATDARGVTVAYAYDALNRLVSATYPDASESVGYEYDRGANAIGRLSAVTDASGRTKYEYDARGNVVAVRSTVDGQTHETRYVWNDADRLIGMTYPSGRTIAYALDATGQIGSVTTTAPNGTSETIASGVTRLPFGPVTGLTLGNGIARQRVFDQDYRPTSLVDGRVLSRGYVWSDVDTIDAITDGIDFGAAQFLEHDALDRLTFAAGAYGELAYVYDGVGNRTYEEEYAEDGTQVASVPYGYAPNSHRLTSVGSRSLAHDAAGNTVADGPRSFAYSDRGRLESATVDGQTSTYRHDAAGRRVHKMLGDGTAVHYVYDLEGRLIAEADGSGAVTVEYAWLDREPLAMWRGDGSGGGGDTVADDIARIEAEDYDAGGTDVGYYDATSGNSGGAHRQDDVDVVADGAASGGFLVTDITDGEWLGFTAAVPEAGDYVMTLRYSVPGTGAEAVEVTTPGGESLVFFDLPATGGVQSLSTIALPPIALAAGTQQLRVNLYAGVGRLDWVALGSAPSGSGGGGGGSGTPPGSGALMANGGFEAGLDGWFSCSDSGSSTITSTASEGAQALELAGGDCLYQEFPIAENASYTISCDALTDTYASVSVTMMDASYGSLYTQSADVTSEGYEPVVQLTQAPPGSAIGAVTLYGEGVSRFDACSVQ